MFEAVLRNITEEDLPKILLWRNQENIRNVMLQNEEIPWEIHLKWYQSLVKNPSKISKVFTVSNIDYGVLNINELNKENKCCSWGFYIGNQEAPKGMGLLLGYTSLNYIFLELGISKVNAEVIESNIISRNYHEKLGFSLYEVLRKQIKRHDNYEDLYVYSISVEEWIYKRKEIEDEIKRRYY